MGLLPHAPVAQKIADQRWLIANSAKIGTFLYKMMVKSVISELRFFMRIFWEIEKERFLFTLTNL